MEINQYQVWTRETAIYPKEKALEYLILGLTSEAGEVAGKYKKVIRDGNTNTAGLIDEIGDVFWYLARIADELDIDCRAIIQGNHDKLESRKQRNVIGGSGDTR